MYRVLIADDEALECKVLEKILLERCPNIKVLPSVYNGVDLVSCIEAELPDIAIIDITMPGLNGLDAMEMIRLKHEDIGIVIVSAHSKFEFAQKALSLGAVDYILKPVKEPLFVETMRKICDTLALERQVKDEKSELHFLQQEYRTAMENEIMSDLLLGELNEQRCDKYVNSLRHSYYGGLLISIRLATEAGSSTNVDSIWSAFIHNLKKICTCFGKPHKNKLVLCLLAATPDTRNNYKEWVTGILRCVLPNLPECIIGISTWKEYFADLSSGVKESHIALYGQKEPAIYFYSYLITTDNDSRFCYQEMRNCIVLLKKGQYNDCLISQEQLFHSAAKENISLQIIQIFALDFIYTALQDVTSDIRLGLGENRWLYWKKIICFRTLMDVCTFLAQIIDSFVNPTIHQRSINKHVRQSIDFISHRYMEDLSMEAVASQNGISAFYLSRLFKQELGITFLELLTDIRISKALELIYMSNDTVEEISEKSGYANVTYFYRLFKKQTGMTIGEMKGFLQLIR